MLLHLALALTHIAPLPFNSPGWYRKWVGNSTIILNRKLVYRLRKLILKQELDGYFCTLLHLVPVRWLGATPKTKPTDRHTDYFSVENYMEKYYPCQSKSHDCWYTQ